MKVFYQFLREHAIKITDFENKKIMLLKNEQQEPYKRQRSATFAKKV